MRQRNILDEFELNGDQIETVFKVETPVTPVKSGYGFQGVLLRDKSNDKVQCHVCGKWFKDLSMHAIKAHGYVRAENYKKEFGLPKNFGLTARSTSRKKSDALEGVKEFKYKDKNPRKMDNLIMKKDKEMKAKISKTLKERAKTDAHDNIYGLCEKQMEARYMVVMDMVGREPTKEDLENHDNALLMGLRRRFGNLSRFRKHYGFQNYREGMTEVTEAEIIASIRSFVDDNGFVPRAVDYLKAGSKPHYSTIKRVYGSWRRALTASGVL